MMADHRQTRQQLLCTSYMLNMGVQIGNLQQIIRAKGVKRIMHIV